MISFSTCFFLILSVSHCQQNHRKFAEMFFSLAGKMLDQDINEDTNAGAEIMDQIHSIIKGMKDFLRYCETCGPDEFYRLLPTIRNILFKGKQEFMKVQSLSDLALMAKFTWTDNDIEQYRECVGEISDMLVDIYKQFMMKEQRIARITTPTTVKPTKGSNEESSYEEYSSSYEDSSEDSSSEDTNLGLPFKLP